MRDQDVFLVSAGSGLLGKNSFVIVYQYTVGFWSSQPQFLGNFDQEGLGKGKVI
jgi:hypothetical protein